MKTTEGLLKVAEELKSLASAIRANAQEEHKEPPVQKEAASRPADDRTFDIGSVGSARQADCPLMNFIFS